MLIRLSILYLFVRQLQATDLVPPTPFWTTASISTYIDKTSFLSEFFNPATANMIITTPPGFGKTTVLSMIEQFAGIELNDDFSVRKFKQTKSFEIFKDTKIAQDDEFIQSHLSHYIVIKLNLQIDLPANFTSDTIRDKVSDLLYAQIEKYAEYLKNITKKSEVTVEVDPEIMKLKRRRNDGREEIEFLRDFLIRNDTFYDGQLMLRRIIKLLSAHFDRKVVLLVDNYDHVAKGFLFKDANLLVQSFYTEINAMIHNAYELQYSSTHLFKIYIMSTTALPLLWVETMQHKFFIRNFTHYRFLNSHALLELMGFTETEVNRLMDKFELKADARKELLIYYNAYLSYPDGKKIYSPKSMILFIENYQKSNQMKAVFNTVYDESLGRIGFLKEHLNNASTLELELLSIIVNQSIEAKIHNFLNTGNLMDKCFEKFNENMKTFQHPEICRQTWSYLFEAGFLVNVDGNSLTSYKVSNQQAQRILYKLFIDHHDESKLPLNELGKCSQQFVRHDVVYCKESTASLFNLVENLLGKCINNTARHPIHKDNEIKYQAILYAASLQLAMNSTTFVVSTMQFRSHSGDVNYGVYFYNGDEKVCAIVILKNANNDDKDKEVFLNEAAATYSLPHGDVKHMLYAVVNVFEDGHLGTFFITYQRYDSPK